MVRDDLPLQPSGNPDVDVVLRTQRRGRRCQRGCDGFGL
jgi:hypothetical protein